MFKFHGIVVLCSLAYVQTTHSMFRQLTRSFLITRPQFVRCMSTPSPEETALCKTQIKELKKKMVCALTVFALRASLLRMDNQPAFEKLRSAHEQYLAKLRAELQDEYTKLGKDEK